MTILSALHDRFSPVESKSADEAQGDPAEARLPFAGYDRLRDREVIGGLSDHSQIELEAVEGYEQSHKNRLPVLDKVRYMRGSEPLPGYDALSVKEIVIELEDADVATIKKVRAYERKFANRPDILEEVVRVHRAHRAAQPAKRARVARG